MSTNIGTSSATAPIAKLAAAISVIVEMADGNECVQLSLLKDHDNPNIAKLTLALDPATMLLVLLLHGPGPIALDRFIERRMGYRPTQVD